MVHEPGALPGSSLPTHTRQSRHRPRTVPATGTPKVAFAKRDPAGKRRVQGSAQRRCGGIVAGQVIVKYARATRSDARWCKRLATVGAFGRHRQVTDAATALLPKFVCSAPRNGVRDPFPRVELVTFAVMVQLPGAPAGMVRTAYVTCSHHTGFGTGTSPQTSHLPASHCGQSVDEVWHQCANPALLLDRVIVRTLVPPTPMLVGANALLLSARWPRDDRCSQCPSCSSSRAAATDAVCRARRNRPGRRLRPVCFTSPPPNTFARLVSVPDALSATDTR